MSEGTFELVLRTQVLDRDEGGHAYWRTVIERRRVPANRVGILICDMWDRHWSRGATERVGAMAPRMNDVVCTARNRGAHVVHAPSETLDFYADTPARRRMQNLPRVEMPPPIDRPDPVLPVDASDHGSDTGEPSPYRAWRRQHPAIEIDQERDGIADNGEEVYRFLRGAEIETLLIMGVHTNMCVLGRSFGIKPMVKIGMDVVLVRDLTDTMYNPAMPPYVDHDEGTRLVVEYIEKFWCPSITSADLLR
jgi:nicotinamidase-related amidase